MSVERSQAQLASLYTTSLEIARQHKVAAVMELTLRHCLELTNSEIGFIDLLNEAGEREMAETQGFSVDQGFLDRYRTIPVHPSVATVVLREERTHISNDVAADPASVGLPKGHPPVRAFLGAPLHIGAAVIGMVAVGNRPGGYDEQDARLLSTFANLVAVAITYARLSDERAQTIAQLESLRRELERLYQESRARAAQDERQRLARELHDSVSQALYGIALGVQSAVRLAEAGDERERLTASLGDVLTLTEAALAEMRSLIFGLRPGTLEEEGLVTGLSKLVAAARARQGLRLDFEASAEPDVGIEAKEALYRIAQEALHNVVKHAMATAVLVRLASEAGQLELIIADDGAGFDPHAHYEGHLGLRGMRERADELGWSLDVDSSPGSGTTVRVRSLAGPPGGD
jgi:signal transduction histidine kinase